jgi:hypothetical protein
MSHGLAAHGNQSGDRRRFHSHVAQVMRIHAQHQRQIAARGMAADEEARRIAAVLGDMRSRPRARSGRVLDIAGKVTFGLSR